MRIFFLLIHYALCTKLLLDFSYKLLYNLIKNDYPLIIVLEGVDLMKAVEVKKIFTG